MLYKCSLNEWKVVSGAGWVFLGVCFVLFFFCVCFVFCFVKGNLLVQSHQTGVQWANLGVLDCLL